MSSKLAYNSDTDTYLLHNGDFGPAGLIMLGCCCGTQEGWYCVVTEMFSNMDCSGPPSLTEVTCYFVTSDGIIHGYVPAPLGVCTFAGLGIWIKYTSLLSFHGADNTCGGGCGGIQEGWYCAAAMGWANSTTCVGTPFDFIQCVRVDSDGFISPPGMVSLGECFPVYHPGFPPGSQKWTSLLSFHGADPYCGGGCF